MIAYVEGPSGDSASMPIVGVVELRDEPGERNVAAALDNALRTLLCLYALDPKHGALGPEGRVAAGRARSESRRWADRAPRSPSGSGPIAWSSAPSADAVARFGTSAPDGPDLAPIKAAYFPDARAYAARRRRPSRPRPPGRIGARYRAELAAARGVTPEAAARDLDAASPCSTRSTRAFLALSVDPELASVHKTIGVVGK